MLKYVFILVTACLFTLLASGFLQISTHPKWAHSMTPLYDLYYTSIDGKRVPLKEYKGKKILFINVASECGFTPQYEDIEKLYFKYKDRLVIVGFPANDFGHQEPGTNEEIAKFCTSKYSVTFPLAEKSSVIGDKKNPVYRWLTDKTQNGWNEAEPNWNFCKYLVSENGELLKVYPSATKPMDPDIISEITKK